MRKLIFAFGALIVMSMFSCIKNSDNPAPDTALNNDTIVSPENFEEVTGVAIDGAMNSVYLLVGEDTVIFNYPDLDGDHKASWDINDTVTVRYVITAHGDSVTDVINEADA